MTTTYTPNKNYPLQGTGDNINAWGTVQNNQLITALDNNLGGRNNMSVAGNSNIALTSAQASNYRQIYSGALTGNIQVTFPNMGGFYLVTNNATGAYTLSILAGSGTPIILPQGYTQLIFTNPDSGLIDVVTLPSAVPTGAVQWFAMQSAPSGWLFCDGSAVSRTTYAALSAAIGTTFGAGDGSTTFNLPDLRGQFIRGFDTSNVVDPSRTFGSKQTGQNAAHTHTVNDPGHNHVNNSLVGNYGNAGGGANVHYNAPGNSDMNGAVTNVSINSSGGAEARPVNVALYGCIKI